MKKRILRPLGHIPNLNPNLTPILNHRNRPTPQPGASLSYPALRCAWGMMGTAMELRA